MGTSGSWTIAIATVVLILVAVLLPTIRHFLSKPKLELDFNMSPPDCQLTKGAFLWKSQIATSGAETDVDPGDIVTVPMYSFRVRVRNDGKLDAANVEVCASKLERQNAKKWFEPVADFPALNFIWSHTHHSCMPTISNNMEYALDIAHIIKPSARGGLQDENFPASLPHEPILSWNLEDKSQSLNHLSVKGVYRLHLAIRSTTSEVVNRTLQIALNGWHDDEDEMLSQGIAITILN